MNYSQLFGIANSVALFSWLILIIVPTWKYTISIIINTVIISLASCYAFFIIKDFGNFETDSFSSLENVKALFTSDSAVFVGWIHYLCFDLLVGTIIVERAQKAGISRWLYSIALPFTFMFGPVGYLIFVIIHKLHPKK